MAAVGEGGSGRTRRLAGPWRLLFLALTAVGVLLAVNQILSLQFFVGVALLDNSFLFLLLACFLAPVFLLFPAGKGDAERPAPVLDKVLFGICLVISLYFAATGLISLEQGWEFESPDLPVVLAFVLWALIMEAVRRAGGTAIFIIFGV
ncbi:MAG: TRAP transporter permease, partial [Alphaproteobacteria bacterium]|nr:TRAP transporter permease [Alphaproteobacteria bacterium]